MRSAERSASTEHLERKAEKTEVRREALSARDISRTLTRLFPHIRVWDIALQKKALGCVPIDIEFWGKASHAAAAPEQGINALDALIQTYNSINALRQHLSDDVRIHGIIVNGGQAPNTVPDYAAANFICGLLQLPH